MGMIAPVSVRSAWRKLCGRRGWTGQEKVMWAGRHVPVCPDQQKYKTVKYIKKESDKTWKKNG